MTDFDPNIDPETQEQADAYVNWCAENYMRVSQGLPRTYRTGVRCAHWMLVVAAAQLHLDDDVELDAEPLREQLAHYNALARAIERQRQKFHVERLIVTHSTIDCWEPVGRYAGNLLTAMRNAVSALILVDLHPLVDLWDLPAPDVWALLEDGRDCLAVINEDADALSFQDYAIRRNETVTAKFTWQRVNNISRRMGAPPISPN